MDTLIGGQPGLGLGLENNEGAVGLELVVQNLVMNQPSESLSLSSSLPLPLEELPEELLLDEL